MTRTRSRIATSSRAAPAPAPAAEAKPLPPNLRRNAPLVPVDSAGGRALSAVIAILTFLAALCAGGAEIVATSSVQWQSSVAREVTIQVRPRPQHDIEAEVARAAELARRTPGVAQADVFSKAEAERLLEPWLGKGLDFRDLPVPRIIVVKLEPGRRPDLAALRQALVEQVPGATLDDHSLWLSRLSTMAYTIVGMGIGLVALVLVATGLAVAFATRGAMAGNRDVVEVLHFVGADDRYIAREFQRRFFGLGLRGSASGAAAALAVTLLLGLLSRSWRASAAGDQIEALFGAFDVSWRGLAVTVALALVVSAVTAIVSRLTVRRFLNGSA